MDEQQQAKMLIQELTAQITLLKAENLKLKQTQRRIAEVNNNYLMLHYLTNDIQDCQTTQELWQAYLYSVCNRGFNYDDAAVLLPDDNARFTIKLSLENGEIIKTTTAVKADYILQAVMTKAPATSLDNLQAAVPIFRKAGVIRAILLLEKKSCIFFEDIQLIDQYVRQTAATVENIILNENLRHFQELLGRQLDQFVMLHYVTKSIHDAGNYYDMLKIYLKTLRSRLVFGFQQGTLYIFDENKLQKADLHDDDLVIVEPNGCECQFVERVAKAREYELSVDCRHLIMALNCFRNITAVVEINHDQEITPEQIRLLDIFTMQTSSAIDNTKLKLHLEYLSFHDHLTQLYNRAFFEKEIQQIESQGRYPTSIIICDLDGLKLVNDTWGHDVGDELIVAAASLIKAAIPQNAIAARTGGDEFAIILTDSSALQVKQVEIDLREALLKYNAELPDIPLAMSIGWAVSSEPVAVIEIFKQADEKMYLDKFLHAKESVEYILKATKQKSGGKTPGQLKEQLVR